MGWGHEGEVTGCKSQRVGGDHKGGWDVVNQG